MDPDIGAVPLRGEGGLPHRERAVTVDPVAQLGDGGPRLLIPRRNRAATVEAVRARRRTVLCVHSLQRGEELAEVLRRVAQRAAFGVPDRVDRAVRDANPGPDDEST